MSLSLQMFIILAKVVYKHHLIRGTVDSAYYNNVVIDVVWLSKIFHNEEYIPVNFQNSKVGDQIK